MREDFDARRRRPLAARRKSWIQLYSSFPFAECLTRLGSAAEKNISYYPRTSGDDRVTFELEMRRDRFSPGFVGSLLLWECCSAMEIRGVP